MTTAETDLADFKPPREEEEKHLLPKKRGRPTGSKTVNRKAKPGPTAKNPINLKKREIKEGEKDKKLVFLAKEVFK